MPNIAAIASTTASQDRPGGDVPVASQWRESLASASVDVVLAGYTDANVSVSERGSGIRPASGVAENGERTYHRPMNPDDPWHPTPATPLGDCRDWCVRMKCGLCDRVGTYRLADMAGTLGRHHTIAQIVARLRCQQCHRPPIDVQLVSTIDPHGPSKAIRITAAAAAGIDRSGPSQASSPMDRRSSLALER